jgi:outer membrane murein-binding lipoprotein Lpp
MCNYKKTLHVAAYILAGFLLLGWSTAGLRAQASPEEIQKRLDALEKEVEALRAELAAARPQASTPAAPSAPAASGESVAAKPEAETSPAGSGGGLKSLFASTNISGFVDGYYGYNFNQPRNRMTSFRSFEGPSNQFSLNMIELIFDKAPSVDNGRLGYRLAFGYGNAMNAVNGGDPGGLGFAQYLKEGYLSYLAPVGNGLQFDFGKFVTPHGAEVIESKDNWNYSRGLLFSYAIPYYHFGLRSKYNLSEKGWVAAYLVNGWNNIVDNNTGKTVGVGFGWTPSSKFSLVQNYMAGPEQTDTNANWRHLSDTLVTISPTSNLSFILNYDYGRGDRVAGLADSVRWQGIAGYVRYAFNEKNAFAVRYEWFDDNDGFTTGVGQQLKEFTTTYEHRISSGLITKLEFRRDYSNQPTFVKGELPAGAQNTVAAGLVYTFDAREGP